MKAYNIAQLKNNPSSAIDDAQKEPVLVIKRAHPQAIIVSFENISHFEDLKKSIALKLYQDDVISLGKAANMAELSYNDFLSLLDAYGIPILKQSCNEVKEDFETAGKWLKKKVR